MRRVDELFCIGVILATLSCIFGCSKEDRNEIIVRTEKAARSLNGGEVEDSEEHVIPTVVANQQKRERIRQNTQWTAENQALHPIEYCQAQLDELDKSAARLEVLMHQISVRQSEVKRKMSDCGIESKSLTKFLDDAKKAYRQAESSNQWPVQIRGFLLAKEKAQEKIVEAAVKIRQNKVTLPQQQNLLNALEKKCERIAGEQRKLEQVRKRVQETICDLKTKKTIDGEKGVVEVLDAINDSLGSIGSDIDNPTLRDLSAPTEKETRELLFSEIMAE